MKNLTLEKAKKLEYGDIVYHKHNKNADNTPQRWKVNGKVQLWKRSPNKISIPVAICYKSIYGKHGLYSYSYITFKDLKDLMIDD